MVSGPRYRTPNVLVRKNLKPSDFLYSPPTIHTAKIKLNSYHRNTMPREDAVQKRSIRDIGLLFFFGIVTVTVLTITIWLFDAYRIPSKWRDFTLLNTVFVLAAWSALRKYLRSWRMNGSFLLWILVHLIIYMKLMDHGITGFGFLIPFSIELVIMCFVFVGLSNKVNY